MIADSTELWVAPRQLRIIEAPFRSLRQQLEPSCPELFAAASKAYFRRISLLKQAIAKYLAEHPKDVSLILLPPDQNRSSLDSVSSPTS